MYKIRVVTSSDKGAGTDESVYLRVFGDKGESTDLLLMNFGPQKKFQPGR